MLNAHSGKIITPRGSVQKTAARSLEELIGITSAVLEA
jgi:hypothetical protein